VVYFMASQPIPGKGDALTYYECTDDKKVVRQLTHIPATGEVERIPDPIVKTLIRPDVLSEASQEVFEQLWQGDAES